MSSDNTKELTDEQIIELFKAGQVELYPQLIERHHQKAYQIAYGILYSHHDAEEVVQDSFVKIYKVLDSFRGDARFSTWMYRIVSNFAKNRYRWNKRRGSHVNVSMDLPVAGKDHSEFKREFPQEHGQPDQKLKFNELEEGIALLLKDIPEIYREALILRNVEHMTYDEISEVLDCKIGTVKSRIARGREELRELLKHKGLI